MVAKKPIKIVKKKSVVKEKKAVVTEKIPAISVNMPLGPVKLKYFTESVESIINQTFKDWELIFVLNGADSEVEKAAYVYAALFKNVVINKLETKDIINARNKAVELSRGKYIALLDSDDIAHPDRLKIQYDFLEEHPEVGFCGTAINIIGPEGELQTTNTTMGFDGQFTSFEKLKNRTKTNNIFVNSTVMVRTDLMKSAPYKREFETCSEDYEVWMNLIWGKGAVATNILIPLVSWRNNPTSFTAGRMDDLRAQALKVIDLYKHHWENVPSGGTTKGARDSAPLAPLDTLSLVRVYETMNLEDLKGNYASAVAILEETKKLCDKLGVQYNIDGGDNKLQELPRYWEYSKGMFLTRHAGNRVLDSGSGYSLFPLALAAAGKEVYSLDDGFLDMRIMQAEQLELKINNVTGQFQKLPYADNFFDVAFSISCLEHLESLSDLNTSLLELRRVVRPGGFVYITTDYYKEYIDYGKALWGRAAYATRYFNSKKLNELIIGPSGMRLVGNPDIIDNTDWGSAPLYGHYTFCALMLCKEAV